MIAGAERVRSGLLIAVVVGTTLAFGGAVWWAGPVLGVAVIGLTTAGLVGAGLTGRVRVVLSPVPLLGLAAIGLAAIQLAPIPAGLMARIAPGSLALSQEVEPGLGRSTISLDRPATLRWLVGAAGCLAVYLTASHATDRAARTRLMGGSVVAAFGLCLAIGLLQRLAGPGAGVPYGLRAAGVGPAWWPTLLDARRAPGTMLLRVAPGEGGAGGLAFARPIPSGAVGPLLGGPGGFLALASLALPLAVGLTLQAVAPRGSRERLGLRLVAQGGAARPILLAVAAVAGAGLAGTLTDWPLAVPIALGVVVAGFGAILSRGVRVASVVLTGLTLAALASGLVLGDFLGRPEGSVTLTEAQAVWLDALRVIRAHPIWGSGFGAYPTVAPLTKAAESLPGTAGSSLLQWVAESGAVGSTVLGLAIAWVLFRLPKAIRRVGSADRPLAAGLLGAVVGFGLASVVGWTVQLPAVALAGGNRPGDLRPLAGRRHGPIRRGVLLSGLGGTSMARSPDPRATPDAGPSRGLRSTAYLRIRPPGDAPEQVVALGDSPIRVGRGADSEVWLPGPDVAEVQCRIVPVEGTWQVRPNGPVGRVVLDGRPIERSETLQPGATLRVGGHVLSLHVEPSGGGRGSFSEPIAVDPHDVSTVPFAGRAAPAPDDQERLDRWRISLARRERWLKARQDEARWARRWRAASDQLRSAAPDGVEVPSNPKPNPPRPAHAPTPRPSPVARRDPPAKLGSVSPVPPDAIEPDLDEEEVRLARLAWDPILAPSQLPDPIANEPPTSEVPEPAAPADPPGSEPAPEVVEPAGPIAVEDPPLPESTPEDPSTVPKPDRRFAVPRADSNRDRSGRLAESRGDRGRSRGPFGSAETVDDRPSSRTATDPLEPARNPGASGLVGGLGPRLPRPDRDRADGLGGTLGARRPGRGRSGQLDPGRQPGPRRRARPRRVADADLVGCFRRLNAPEGRGARAARPRPGPPRSCRRPDRPRRPRRPGRPERPPGPSEACR